MIFLRRVISLLLLFFTFSAKATFTPLGGGLFPMLQFPPTDQDTISGIRVNPGYGLHKNVYGIDAGLIANETLNNFVGVSFAGGVNITGKRTVITGLQFAGITNYNRGKADIIGLQFALGVNHAAGLTRVYGVQLGGIANTGKNIIYGLQAGFYNVAETVYGFQIGLINKAKNLHGIQIGLMNYHTTGWISAFPIINIGF